MRRNSLSLIVVLWFAVFGACACPAHAQDYLAHAPKRLALRDFVDDLVQCNIRVTPDAVLAAHARYCEEYRAVFTRLDDEHSRQAGPTVADENAIPVVKDVQRRIQQGRISLAHTTSLADALLDDLQRAIPADQLEAFRGFRDECHIRLLIDHIGGGGALYRVGAPQDLGGWLRAAQPTKGQSADARAAIATARLARSAERRTAWNELISAVDEARLREARRAAELGVEGLAFQAALEQLSAQRHDQTRANEVWNLRTLGLISPQARARLVAVELDAWRAAAPLLPASGRRYAASTFLEVLACQGSEIGNSGGLPPDLLDVHYGGGLDVVRVALSLPELTHEQRQALRQAGAEWLDARAVEFERLATLAARADYEGSPDPANMNQIDSEHRHKLAVIAKAEWLEADTARDSTLRGAPPHGTREKSHANLPQKSDLVLSPEDDALFPLPRGGANWNAPGERSWDEYQVRRNGWPPQLPRTVDADAERLLAASEDQRLIIQTICADFRNEWSTVVQPLIETAKKDIAASPPSWSGMPMKEEERELRRARRAAALAKAAASRQVAWAACNKSLQALSDHLAAIVPADRRSTARVWAAQQQLWIQLPYPGWDLSMPNLPAATMTPWLSREGRALAMGALATTAEAMVAKADARRTASLMVDGVDPAMYMEFDENGVPHPGDDPFKRWTERATHARDAFLAQCKQETERIAGLLNPDDAAVWRSSVNAQRTPFAYHTLKDVMIALEDAPEQESARAAVAAENRALEALGDLAFQILRGLPEVSAEIDSQGRGPDTELHARAAVYQDLARDLRSQALWRLKSKVPPDVVRRVGLFKQVEAIGALGSAP